MSMSTSRACLAGYAVFCALFGVFILAVAASSKRPLLYAILGVYWLGASIYWAVATLRKRKA